jgi:CRP-like cAMP-binding protein
MEILQFLNNVYPLQPELIEHLKKILKIKKLAPKEFLLHAGTTCKHVYFVEKGLLRCFHLKDGEEVNKWFMKEEDVVYAVRSFLTQQPSTESIQALEACTLYYISHSELQDIYRRFKDFMVQRAYLTEKYYIMSEERNDMLLMPQYVERYRFLLDNYPDLVSRVQTKHIASYMGVSLPTMYRLKSKVMQR